MCMPDNIMLINTIMFGTHHSYTRKLFNAVDICQTEKEKENGYSKSNNVTDIKQDFTKNLHYKKMVFRSNEDISTEEKPENTTSQQGRPRGPSGSSDLGDYRGLWDMETTSEFPRNGGTETSEFPGTGGYKTSEFPGTGGYETAEFPGTGGNETAELSRSEGNEIDSTWYQESRPRSDESKAIIPHSLCYEIIAKNEVLNNESGEETPPENTLHRFEPTEHHLKKGSCQITRLNAVRLSQEEDVLKVGNCESACNTVTRALDSIYSADCARDVTDVKFHEHKIHLGTVNALELTERRDEEKTGLYISTKPHVKATTTDAQSRYLKKARPNTTPSDNSRTSFREEQERFKSIQHMTQERYAISKSPGEHPVVRSDKSTSEGFNMLGTLHASVASKIDEEFCPDFGKGPSLQFIENAAVYSLLMPDRVLPESEQRYWEILRLGSFSVMADLAVFAIRLAQSGFYYDPVLDDIQCYSCHLSKKHWEKHDKIALVHLELRPDCKHAKFEDDRNIPVPEIPYPVLTYSSTADQRSDSTSASTAPVSTTASTLSSFLGTNNGSAIPTVAVSSSASASTTPVSRQSVSTPSRPLNTSNESVIHAVIVSSSPSVSAATHTASAIPDQQNPIIPAESVSDSDLQSDGGEHGAQQQAWTQGKVDLRLAASPSNATVTARMASFMGCWPTRGVPSHRRMVLAGFYYLGIADSVRCFYCGITLKGWEPNDDPWETHVRFRFSCDYVKAVRGEDYVRETVIKLATGNGNVPLTNGETPLPSNTAAQSRPTASTSGNASLTPSLSPATAVSNITRSTSAASAAVQAPVPVSASTAGLTQSAANPAPAHCGERRTGDSSSGATTTTVTGAANQHPTNKETANQHEARSGNAANEGGAEDVIRPSPSSSPSSSQPGLLQTDAESSTTTSQNGATFSTVSPPSRPSTGNVPSGRVRSGFPGSLSVGSLSTGSLSVGSSPTWSSSIPHREDPAPSNNGRPPNADPNPHAHLQQLLETNQRLQQRHRCRLCQVRAVDTLFMPCGHLCTCAACAPSITRCCLCSAHIMATAQVYFDGQ
ncbi:uncharacterized protein LOC143298036 [Babylonia areolata]|uniref:uncharacterized protein LOC143298036 n=1 Tax=Babylonia areolata TaxID=304850 RepID=UPI003FD2B5BC